jgi:outer membrane protein assembly factor BamA
MARGTQVPRSRARRVPFKALVLAVLVLAPALLFLLYRPGVQARLFAAALRNAEAATGLSLSAREVTMDPLRGRLVLRGVVAAVPGSRPFLTADEAEIEVDVGEGLRRRLHVRHLAAEGLRIDLSAPLPASQGTSTGDLTFLSAAEIDHVLVGISSLASGPLPPSLQDVALGAKLEQVRLTGSLRGGTLSLRGDLPIVVVDRPGPLRLAAAGDVAVTLTAAGRIDLEALHLAGDGFSASARGTVGLSADAPIALHAEVSAETGKVAPELGTAGAFRVVADVGGSRSALSASFAVDGRDVRTPAVALETVSVKARLNEGTFLVESARADLRPGGRVEAEGRFDLAAGDGTWTVRAERLPDGLLAAFADEATRARWGIAGSELDGVATVRYGRGDPLPLSVNAGLSLSRDGTTLATASGRLESRGATTLDLSATLLPDSPGERRAEASVRAPTLAGLSSGRLVDGRLRVRSPDLAATHAELRTLFPSLVAAAPEGIDLAGEFRLDVRAAGPLLAPRADVDAAFDPARGGSLSLRAVADSARRSVEGTLRMSGLSVGTVHPGATGLASADATFAVGPKRRDVRVTLDATGLCLAEDLPLLENLHATLEAEGPELRIVDLDATGGGSPGSEPGLARLEASGRLSLTEPFRDADVDAVLSAWGLSAEAHALLRDGVLALDIPRAGRPGLEAALAARLPLGALRVVPSVAAYLPRGLPEGPLELTLDAPGFDSCALEAFLPEAIDVVPVTGDLRVFAALPLSDPLGGSAAVELEGASMETPAGRLAVSGPARLTLSGGQLVLEPVTFDGERTSFLVSASADLVPGVRQGASLAGLFSHVAVAARGRADAAFLSPFLAGGTASGEIALDVRAAGPPDALEGRIFLDGKGSRFSWPLAWPTEIRDPHLEAELTPGTASLTRGEALLNGGPLLISGGWYRGAGTTLTALFADVRYRLAYGLAATLSGGLTFDVIEDERRISGTVTLDRGLLERDIDLDREILARVLAPPEATGTEKSLLDTLALDIGIETASGVRIRNNVADLSASWSRLEVTGTARRPVIRGRIDVGKNGLVFAYGQAFRVDKGVITYTGDPATDPRLDFVTTSSLQDNSVVALRASSDVFESTRESFQQGGTGGRGEADAAARLAWGLAGYYSARLASTLGQALGQVAVSTRPVFVLGETDPTARLTLSREFSRNVTLAASFDLRNAQKQTWVVDVHRLRKLPPVGFQLFTDDDGSWGGTLQQRIELGGTRGRGADPDAPLLGAVRASTPDGIPRRGFLASLGLTRGAPVTRDFLFDAQIDAETWLRGRGWPEARVFLKTVPSRKAGRADVEASLDPGPRVAVEFEGDPLPAASRRAVADLYRTGILEPSALEEMSLEARRALRALGHLEPRAEASAAGTPEGRRVVVTISAGRRVDLAGISFEGLSPAEAASLTRRFGTPLARVELAAGLPSADARLVQALRALGYPNGSLVRRELSEDGRTLTVEVDPSLPSLVDSVVVRGVPEEEARDLVRRALLSPGEPADADRASLSALAMEDALRERGFAEARVRVELSPASPEDPPRIAAVFAVDAGPAERVGTVSLEGLSRTSAGWARKAAGLEPGGVFRQGDLARAQADVFALGLFESVKATSVPRPGGAVDVVLAAEERPPFSFGYGVRWESDSGLAAVVDVVDRNLLGRGVTLGLRGLYDPDDRAVRAFGGLPEVLLGFGVEGWYERRRTWRAGLFGDRQTDTGEASLQLSRTLSDGLSARLYGRYRTSRIFEDDPFFPLDVTIEYPYVGGGLVWDDREDPLLGTRGLLATLDLETSGGWLGSSFSYARAYGQASYYRPVFGIGAGRVVWAQSLRLGFAKAFQGQVLIPDVRFFAGGSYSVRGYPTESLGPREDLGGELFPTGGSTLLVLNEELRVPLHAMLVGVGFFDVGQVWASSGDFGSGLAISLGLGLRALTPIGVLRLDGALPLDRRPGDPAFKVYFGFGNVF